MAQGGVALLAVAALATLAAFAVRSGEAPASTALLPTETPASAASAADTVPHTWIQGLDGATGSAILISCFDGNVDGRIDAEDDPTLSGLDIPLAPGEACIDPARHRDFYVGAQLTPADSGCDAGKTPLLVVAIASGGSDLLDATSGESLGLLRIVNDLQTRARESEIATEVILSTAAIFGAEFAQTGMEQWLAHYVGLRLAALPCLRAVLLGHSHGGVTVTSVTAALDRTFGARMLGVALDRTVALYDRPAAEYPDSATILNVYQTNEGWHGDRVDLPNVINDDESAEYAPVALSDGGGGLAPVIHTTLDDSTGVQRRIEDAVMGWLLRRP